MTSKLYIAYTEYQPEDNEEHSSRIIGIFDTKEGAAECLIVWMDHMREINKKHGDRADYFTNKDKPMIVEVELNMPIKYGLII
jgi:hypothetical protein